jgi:4-amino-4-deoxy-L-arabinose transferase-like glycosyltransferase
LEYKVGRIPTKKRSIILDRIVASFRKTWSSINRRLAPKNTMAKIHALPISMKKIAPVLFVLSLLMYITVRLIRLEDFPIYFFTDEAVQTVLASDFLRDGFRNYDGHFFPTYFKNVYEYNLNLSVYLQVIPYRLFGKSIFVTRATAALFTLLAPLSLGLLLKRVFADEFYWLVVPVLSATPAWFLHSRTAFETSIMVALYAAFLYAYLMYRTRAPRYLYLAASVGALVFYAYGPGQIIMLATGAFLFILDFRYHLRHRQTFLIAVGLLVILAFPYARFQIQVPGKHTEFLRLLGSHWLQDLSIGEKLKISAQHYWRGLNPAYWFLPNDVDLSRHRMDDYGHISLLAAPLVLIGLACTVRRIQEPGYRTIIASTLAIPFAGIVVGPGITRLLAMTLPMAILATLGITWLGSELRTRISYPLVVWSLFILGVSANAFILSDAVRNAPTWSRDYGLSGMQYGAKQVFTAIDETLAERPRTEVFLTPTWANGADVLRRFFFPDDAPIYIANAEAFLREKKELDPHMLFILTEAEYEEVRSSNKFQNPDVERLLPYPDGSPGFYFLHLAYSRQADSIFAREAEVRQKPVSDKVHLGDHDIVIEHPRFDLGEIEQMFDGDPFTMVRTERANPALFSLRFDPPMTIEGITLTTGSMDMTLSVRILQPDQEDPLRFSKTFQDLPPDPTVDLSLGEGPYDVSRFELEIEGFGMDDPSRVHIRDLSFY